MTRPWNTDEARAVRHLRDECARQPADPLATRARLVGEWKARAAANPANRALDADRGAWWLPFRSPNFRHLLMPGARAQLDAHDRAWERQWLADLRAWSQRCRREKAMRKAARGPLPYLPLFDSQGGDQ